MCLAGRNLIDEGFIPVGIISVERSSILEKCLRWLLLIVEGIVLFTKTVLENIGTDPLSMYTYVITKNLSPDTPPLDGRIYTYRLSRIDKVVEKPNVSGAFSSEERLAIDKDITEKGVQFVGDYLRTIVVEFTDQGIKELNSQLHLRPHIKKIREDKHTYEFQCTRVQAFGSYFQKQNSYYQGSCFFTIMQSYIQISSPAPSAVVSQYDKASRPSQNSPLSV